MHLKANVRKAFSNVLKLSAGIEDYVRNSTLKYEANHYQLNYNILAAHVDAQWRIVPRVFLNASARVELLKSDCLSLPRATLSYIPNNYFQFSLMAGRYSQAPADDYLAQSQSYLSPHRGTGGVLQSTADHAILSMQYKAKNTL